MCVISVVGDCEHFVGVADEGLKRMGIVVVVVPCVLHGAKVVFVFRLAHEVEVPRAGRGVSVIVGGAVVDVPDEISAFGSLCGPF